MKRQLICLLIGIALVGLLASSASALSPQPKYEALNPRGMPEPVKLVPLAPRVSDLNDKMVYVINVGKMYADEIIGAIAELLPQYFPRVKAVHTAKKLWYGTDEPELWKEVKERANAVVIAPKD